MPSPRSYTVGMATTASALHAWKQIPSDKTGKVQVSLTATVLLPGSTAEQVKAIRVQQKVASSIPLK